MKNLWNKLGRWLGMWGYDRVRFYIESQEYEEIFIPLSQFQRWMDDDGDKLIIQIPKRFDTCDWDKELKELQKEHK